MTDIVDRLIKKLNKLQDKRLKQKDIEKLNEAEDIIMNVLRNHHTEI